MMKNRWITAAVAAVMLVGCTPTSEGSAVNTETAPAETETPKTVITNQVDIRALNDPADLSGYQWLEDDEPAFVEISLQESIRMFSEGGSGIVVYSSDTCPWCNRAIPILNEVLKEKGVRAYYIDTNQPIASDAVTSMELYNELCGYISSIFETNDEGEPTFQIPEVIAVKDGEIVGHHLSLVDGFVLSDSDVQMDDSQKEELRTIYRGLIEACAD